MAVIPEPDRRPEPEINGHGERDRKHGAAGQEHAHGKRVEGAAPRSEDEPEAHRQGEARDAGCEGGTPWVVPKDHRHRRNTMTATVP